MVRTLLPHSTESAEQKISITMLFHRDCIIPSCLKVTHVECARSQSQILRKELKHVPFRSFDSWNHISDICAVASFIFIYLFVILCRMRCVTWMEDGCIPIWCRFILFFPIILRLKFQSSDNRGSAGPSTYCMCNCIGACVFEIYTMESWCNHSTM